MKRVGGLSTGIIAVVLAASVLTACSDDNDSSAPDPVRGGTLIEALAKPASEDPALATTVSERVIADQLYDGLTTWEPRGLETRPALAQRWESNGDNTQWTFTLRDAKAG